MNTVYAAATWHVTQNGAGSANGTSLANAWSATQFNTSGNWGGGASDIMPGDTVLFNGTITTSLNMQGSGTSGSPIIIDGSSATMNVNGPNQVGMNGKSFITFQNWTFNANIATGTLIRMGNTSGTTANVSNIILQNNDFVSTNNTNSVQALHIKACANCLIVGNTFDNVQAGISGDTTNLHDVTIRNNYIRFHTKNDNTNQRDVIRLGDAYNMLIEGNVFILRGDGTTQHNDIIQFFQSGATPNAGPKDWTVRYNWFELDTLSANNRSWLMWEDMQGVFKVYGNVFLGTDGGESANGIAITRGLAGFVLHMHHNTIVSRSGPNQLINFDGTGTFNLKNNIFYDIDTAGTVVATGAPGAFTHQDNSYSGGNVNGYMGTNCATYAHATELCNQDPGFENFAGNDFSLDAASALVGAGQNLGAEYAIRLAPGAVWPDPETVEASIWDIGAFASVGGLPVPPGGRWQMNDGQGTTVVDIQNAHHGTLVDLDAFAAWVSGVQGTALNFPGTGYVNVPDAPELNIGGGQDFSVLFWVKTTAALNTEYPTMVAKMDLDASRDDWSIARAASTDGCSPDACQWYGALYVAGERYGCESRRMIHDGAWHLLAITRAGDVLSCYQDHYGLQQANQNAAIDNDVTNLAPLRFGRSGFGAPFEYYFTGQIDDVQIYSRALTAMEITQIYQAGTVPPEPGSLRGRVRLSGRASVR